jgi:RNA-directed DNA polymerase
VLDADICKCFDQINHNALLDKLNTFPQLYRQIRAWLKAGMMEGKTLFPTSEGTPQGGTASPILANIALHGLEKQVNQISPQARLIRYYDDFVVLHEDLQVIHKCQSAISLWLSDMGLSLKPSKTHISHTLKPYQGRVGFDFLGFTVRQFPVGKYQCGKIGCKGKNPQPLGFKTLIKPSQKALKRQVEKVGSIINAHRSANSQRLIQRLNPIIRGWARYYSTVVSKASFEKLDNLVYQQLRAWARRRHSNKSAHWRVGKYWRTVGGDRWYFATTIENRIMRLFKYRETPIRRHIKVKGNRSPYDGDWIYWSTRQGRHPQTPTRVAKLLKQQGVKLRKLSPSAK